ncbi:hypothetical protein GHT07_13035 [Caenimonas koreensis DSM 17982]|uniref:Uncharacterized protein n=1 Tax=Caenimonas koreensis DSM 17982 TaxID=1121255 RepID=A0A844B9Q2_9BURK|nr:hypothetical protein [Caenimonas koreensis]MRD48207.1 hypothetical protein [Caenimonas koreensis DSM 17982]
MSLIKKIFGAGSGSGSSESKLPPPSTTDSDSTANERETPHMRAVARRELVHMILRETMRKHAIPKDWITARVLSVESRARKAGVHVQFIVHKGDDQLMSYVHQFQEGFWQEVEKMDKTARQWIFSLAWQFDGKSSPNARPIQVEAPAPSLAAQAEMDDTMPEAGDTIPHDEDAVDLESDLAALYAAVNASVPDNGTPPTQGR